MSPAKDWTEEDWLKVEFSDESTFQQFRACSEIVRRPLGERFNPSFTKKTVKHPPSVMVWGSFDGSVGRGRLFFLPKGVSMNSSRYLEVLQDNLIPIFRVRRLSWFLQDSSPCHASKSTRAFLTNENIPVRPWPGNSPDLNPIENLREQMKKKVAEKEPSSFADLKNKILEV